MSNKKKILFIVNPVSGHNIKVKLEDIIPYHLDLDQFDWSLKRTQQQGDAEIWSREAVIDNFTVVVAVGGDGTINEVARGLVGSKTALAVIPRGSGNGFANYFKIPKDPIQAIGVINNLSLKKIDTGRFNDKLFLCVAGVGFDAQVAYAFDNHHKRGFLSYIQLTLKEYLNYKPATYHIKYKDLSQEVIGLLITAANSTQFGNNAHIAPNADIADGKLELVVLKPFPFWAAISIGVRLFNGTIHKSRFTETISIDEVVIKSNENTVAQVDGEPFSCQNHYEIKVNPQSLQMVC
ncbi:diacylglycerol/lipid kinase family protein [Reichenbachiella versicolor]|uniref:diacylglycerol/lipid kinase family protein n=1 Tax=Reichenbachiella versicolor TaxID=1821036 RepID=UPI0013A58CAA|nr:diacylglycerol kinase family protein [Reichenbachiella versicolor]